MFKTRKISELTFVFSVFMVFGGLLCSDAHSTEVVINEIHSNPDVKTELVEFVELYNTSGQDVDLSGWNFSEGILYTFEEGTTLPANGYLIVCQSPADINAKWSLGRFQLPQDAIYGPYGGKLSNEGEQIALCNADGEVMDEVDYQLGFPWPTVGDPASEDLPGTGYSMQLVNPLFDNDLAGSWRSATPTPLAGNNPVFADNIPPHIRQLKHSPQQPRLGDIVTITAKVTDPDGVDSVLLMYQSVDPGDYFSTEHQQFYKNWNAFEMHDDGLNGDLSAGDDIYTVQLPESLQIHRRLVRYRINVTDSLGYSLIVPYSDDPQPNFAYFVYDGVPAWKGAIRSGRSVVEYNSEIMSSLPIYHLISRAEDVYECQYVPISDPRCNPEASIYKWTGTLVYDGVVYDHIRYRARGGGGTYSYGKNRWKFDFNRGHYFQARDDYGNKYREKWDKLNFSACFQFSGTNNRGEQGMYEAVTARLFALASVPVSNMSWLHFRVIDDVQEANPNDQYEGDFWGLYLAIEQPDGRFLDRNNLPDGNMYKMYFPCNGDEGNMSNQGPNQVTDHSDVIAFCQAYHRYPSDRQWWEQTTNLDLYYSYRLICDAVHHYDLSDRWNCFYYHHPETNRWWMLPWDFDHSWDTDIYTDDSEYWKQVLDRRFFQGHNVGTPSVYHQFPDCIIAFQNRARGLNDLLINAEQCVQLINECAAIISNPDGGLSFVDADRAMWDQNPHNTNPGTYYQSSPTGDFAGMVQRMRDFISPGGWGYNRIAFIASDNDIPHTPTVRSTSPANYPINTLTFETNPFSDPQGSYTFAAMKWRIGEVNTGSEYVMPINEHIIIIPEEDNWKYFKGTKEPSARTGQWRMVDFDDSDWLEGQMTIGYGESFINTTLNDMQGSYSTIYLRKEFNLFDVADIGSMNLEVIFDDGVNIWINGVNVLSENVPGTELAYDAVTSNRTENHDFVSYSVSELQSMLIEGTNVIAVQVVNQSIGSSSDCYINVRLTYQENHSASEDAIPTPDREPGKYEIDAVWESEEIADPQMTSVTIPASVVSPGQTYRVRCRMKDNTGRWSHWSDPLQFVAGEPVSQGVAANLRITELMYNPMDPSDGTNNDDYEFIELKNIGDSILDLTHVSFTDGIVFDFSDSTITQIEHGQFVLIVSNISAFELRYGQALSPIIAGEYSGKFANGGERVALVDYWDGTIADFEYGDEGSWPALADGQGYSLVLLDSAMVEQNDGSLSNAANWRASTDVGGSPGTDDP
ncbi:MAG: lamin tail domain-containing protein [Sedimentisphaerales bacterium]|nr:lamin tail domain-containing protein [Sedimentisphaerales bacterium]